MEPFNGDPTGFPLQLNFVHKRLLGAAKGFVLSGFSPTAAAAGFVTSGGGGRAVSGTGSAFEAKSNEELQRLANSGVAPATRSLARQELQQRGTAGKFTSGFGVGCLPGFARDATGRCVTVFSPTAFVPGGDPLFSPPRVADGFGGAVMGRYGVALQPEVVSSVRRRCPRGAVLGNDGLCYDSLPKKDRMWIPARRPLLTGGDLNAISRAAKAARRMKAQTKKLQSLGMLERPKPRRLAAAQAQAHHAK